MSSINSHVLLCGHSLADYNKMFLLDENDRNSKLLDCYSGTSSFNAELTAQGGQVTSCDPCILPNLDFAHEQFDLALCSHFLFTNCPDQSPQFHIHAIERLCQVAKEVRIFPLLNINGEIPAVVGPVIQSLQQSNHGVEIVAVPYESQKKGNAMLRVWAQTCQVTSCIK